jgi:hypothetical protein
MRWNPDPDDVQKVGGEAGPQPHRIHPEADGTPGDPPLEAKTLSAEEIENVGLALMKLEETVRQIAKRFKLNVEDLNLDLGPIGRLH